MLEKLHNIQYFQEGCYFWQLHASLHNHVSLIVYGSGEDLGIHCGYGRVVLHK